MPPMPPMPPIEPPVPLTTSSHAVGSSGMQLPVPQSGLNRIPPDVHPVPPSEMSTSTFIRLPAPPAKLPPDAPALSLPEVEEEHWTSRKQPRRIQNPVSRRVPVETRRRSKAQEA